MHRSRRPRRHSARPSFALLSVLALLALASFPVLAQAESGIPEYETQIPTVQGHHAAPTRAGGTPAHASTSPSTAKSGNREGSESGSSKKSSSGGSGKPNSGGGGGSGQSSPGNGSNTPKGKESLAGQEKLAVAPVAAAESSSSPLVPILIAIAALAAISIGFVVVRQRRQRRDGGGEVSPKAS
jgi:cobalamin biosynthesis Mg chelatase CobN